MVLSLALVIVFFSHGDASSFGQKRLHTRELQIFGGPMKKTGHREE